MRGRHRGEVAAASFSTPEDMSAMPEFMRSRASCSSSARISEAISARPMSEGWNSLGAPASRAHMARDHSVHPSLRGAHGSR